VVDQASKIREEIANGRAELAETVQALVEKADVKARVKEAVSENAEHVQQKASELAGRAMDVSKSTVGRTGGGSAPYIAGGVFALLLLWIVVRRRRRRPE
jgi:MYXO-CTERM domain-containing protein